MDDESPAGAAPGDGDRHLAHLLFLGMFISPVLMTLLNGMTGSMQDSLLLFALLTLAIAGATGIASARMGAAARWLVNFT